MARLAVIYSILRNSHKKQLKQRRDEHRMMRYTDKAFSMNEDEFKANYRVGKKIIEAETSAHCFFRAHFFSAQY